MIIIFLFYSHIFIIFSIQCKESFDVNISTSLFYLDIFQSTVVLILSLKNVKIEFAAEHIFILKHHLWTD